MISGGEEKNRVQWGRAAWASMRQHMAKEEGRKAAAAVKQPGLTTSMNSAHDATRDPRRSLTATSHQACNQL